MRNEFKEQILDGWTKTNPFRCRMVVFEGLDKTGKTLLQQRVRVEGGYTVWFLERGIVSRMVFVAFNKVDRNFPWWDWHTLEDNLIRTNSYAIVWCRTNYEEIQARHVKAKEEIPRLEDLMYQNCLFSERIRYLQSRGVPVLELWTDKISEDEAVEKVLSWTKIIQEGKNGNKSNVG